MLLNSIQTNIIIHNRKVQTLKKYCTFTVSKNTILNSENFLRIC